MSNEETKLSNGLLPEPVKYTTTEEELKKPTQGLILAPAKPEDYVFGGSSLPRVILRPDGQHDNYLPVQEIQRTLNNNDTFMCVSYSLNNNLEIIHKEQYGYELNFDDLFTGVGSGTVPYQGNSVVKVAEWVRKNGFIKEKGRLLEPMTIDKVYTPLTAEERVEGLKNLEIYEFGYEWLERPGTSQSATPETLKEALKYGPVQASVDGTAYRFNQSGYIGDFIQYTHEITVFGYEEGKFWKIFDSETQQALKFAWGYPLGFPMRHVISLTNKPMLYKTKDSPAIYALDTEKKTLIAFSDGVVSGGKFLKVVYGVDRYSQIPRVPSPDGGDWDELPFPIDNWKLTSEQV